MNYENCENGYLLRFSIDLILEEVKSASLLGQAYVDIPKKYLSVCGYSEYTLPSYLGIISTILKPMGFTCREENPMDVLGRTYYKDLRVYFSV